jgi:hypothetical protein
MLKTFYGTKKKGNSKIFGKNKLGNLRPVKKEKNLPLYIGRELTPNNFGKS